MMGVQFGSVDWQFGAKDATHVILVITTVESGGFASLDGFTLSGIPGFSIDSGAEPCIGAVISGGFLELEFASVPVIDFVLEILPNDLAFRGPFGEYLVSKEMIVKAPPAPPTNATVTSVAINGTGIDVALDGAGGTMYLNGVPNIGNTTTAEAPLSANINATVIHLEYLTPVSSGDVIDWVDAAGWFLNSTLGSVNSFSLPVP